ncbi:hypothetical protein ACFQY0_06925 [Haloferula chungangensis]|uniref:Uncharacterized protein n=1 Tax=Haloferula chungangensis TaxID=1048331 RepID=A0ABW2L6L1_9BACT
MKSRSKTLKRCAIAALIALLLTYTVLWIILANLSVSTHGSTDLNFGNIRVPSKRTIQWNQRSPLMDSVMDGLAKKYRHNLKFDKDGGDRLFSQLATGQNIDEVNRILQQAEPWAKVGSNRDYDFTLCQLTLMLYNFGDRPEILHPQTVGHVVNVLMTEKGGEPVVFTPGILGLPLRDTENHVLMTEGSRYLTNQWIARHGNPDPQYDNSRNGLEAFLLDYLEGMERAGIHEYNSIPYVGYTLRSLLNIASFAEGPIKEKATHILDRMNWDYALGSMALRRFPPFRRQFSRARETNLDGDYHTSMMKAWMSLAGMDGLKIRHGQHHAMWVNYCSYRPADAVVEWVRSKPEEYFVRIGHGSDGSPEIYSGGPGFLITAGGVADDFARQCVARPTTLMLDDGASDLRDLLHIEGPGDEIRSWNNTGVHRRFAVAAGPVSIPDEWSPSLTISGWSFYERAGQKIAVYAADELGIFCVLPKEGALPEQAAKLAAANADPDRLANEFIAPDATVIGYDVFAEKHLWVIESVAGSSLDRHHDGWPLSQGSVPGFSGDPSPSR